MVCRLCLSTRSKTMAIFSEEKIQKCITKFLQLELSPDDPVSKEICVSCWIQLDSFRRFFHQIKEVQKSLSLLENYLVEEDKEELEGNIIENSLDTSPVKESEATVDEDDLFSVESEQHEHLKLSNNAPKAPKSVLFDISEEQADSEILINKETYECSTTEGESQPPEANANTNDKNIKETNYTEDPVRFSRPMQARKDDDIVKEHMKLKCDICLSEFNDFGDLQIHFQIIHNCKGYAVCCNKKLYTRSLIIDHINVHNDPNYFKCQHCDKALPKRSSLKQHMLKFHSGGDNKVFQCSFCSEKLASQYLLDLHAMKHVPKDKYPFVCNECGKCFATSSTLDIHKKRIHSMANERICEICGKIFRHSAAFARHMEEHKGIIHPQVQCTQCGSWLKDQQNLRYHIYNVHTNKTLICNVCGKESMSRSSHLTHIRYMHQTVPVFKCTICEKKFKKALKLKEHVTTHTGEFLYTCLHCPKKFRTQAERYSHRKKIHRKEWEANRRGAKKVPKNQT